MYDSFEEYLVSKIKEIKDFKPENEQSKYYIMGAIDTLEELLDQIKTGENKFPIA